MREGIKNKLNVLMNQFVLEKNILINLKRPPADI